MPIFLERFVLPILAAVVMGVCLFNPWKWDSHQRASLFVGVVSLAYFFAYTSYRIKPETTQTSAPAIETPKKSGNATTSGDNSPAVTSDGNNITYDQSTHTEKKPAPPK